jgi:hypothetical protein
MAKGPSQQGSSRFHNPCIRKEVAVLGAPKIETYSSGSRELQGSFCKLPLPAASS